MKKLTAIIFTLGLILTLSACDLDDVAENKKPVNSTPSATDVSSIPDASSVPNAPSESITGQGASSTDSSADATSTKITRERAIEIALEHAGFKQSQVINLSADYDKEPNGNEWEIEFDKDGYEYSYGIDAANGKILHNKKEIDD